MLNPSPLPLPLLLLLLRLPPLLLVLLLLLLLLLLLRGGHQKPLGMWTSTSCPGAFTWLPDPWQPYLSNPSTCIVVFVF